MYHMVVLVLDELEACSDVLDAWEAANVSGVTIIESTGLGRAHEMRWLRDDFSLMPSLSSLLQSREEQHRTMFTLVDSMEMVDKLFAVTTAITGDLDGPNKGIMFVLPVTRVVGIVPKETTE